MKRYVLAITGASGPIIGLRVLRALAAGAEVHAVLSEGAVGIVRDEAGLDLSGLGEEETTRRLREYAGSPNIHAWSPRNLYAPISSGSYPTDGMLVAPCSMKTLAGIAHGYAETLIERAADVTIKEGRRLVLAPREMPLSAIHLRNMLSLSELGVRIAPPVPAFYFRPETLDDMVDFLAGKLLDTLGVDHSLYRRWPN